MHLTEPYASALLVAAFGLLLVLAVTFSRTSARLGVPLAIGFLVIGVLAGSEGIGRIPFEDYHRTFQIGTAALVLILFDGGLNTPSTAVREAIGPASVLATVGVALTALLTAAAAHLLGFSWPLALCWRDRVVDRRRRRVLDAHRERHASQTPRGASARARVGSE